MMGAALLAGSLAAAPSAWLADLTAFMGPIGHRYANRDYGFTLPPYPVTYVGRTSNPNHGVIIVLGEKRDIRVYAEYAAADDPRDDLCRTPFNADDPGVTRRGMGWIGGRRACAVTNTHAGSFARVLQRLGRGKASNIVLTVWLETTARAKTIDLAAMRTVAASIKPYPIYP